MTSVTVYYDAPDCQDIDLDDEQEELWDKYKELSDRARQVPWNDPDKFSAIRDVELAYEEFLDSIYDQIEYGDLVDAVESY